MGSYAPIPTRDDQVAQMFGTAGQAAPTTPNSIKLGSFPIQLQPDEARVYEQTMGKLLSSIAPTLTPTLQKLQPDLRAQVVAQIEAEARKAAEGQVLATMASSGQLTARVQQAQQTLAQTKTNRVL
jgi:hypothetical protein